MLGGLAAAYLVARHLPFLSTAGAAVFHDAGIVLIAGAIICAVGVLDDLIELDALTKLGGQVARGRLPGRSTAVQLLLFTLPGAPVLPDPPQAALLTVLLVVGTVNAVNFVDGLDGLAAGVVGIGAVAFFVFSYQLADAQRRDAGDHRRPCSAPLLAGACAGFLPHNFYPARIFMGDSGSMLLGPGARRLRADADRPVRGTRTSAQGGGGSDASLLPMLLPILLPISILVVPFADLVLAVVRRTRRGQMFYQPGQAAPAPPAAGDRALPAPCGADHVAVGGPDRLRHRAGQPLRRPG